MGKKDTITKEYMRNPVIFADVFNQFIYQGKQVISSANLTEIDTTEIVVPYGTDNAAVPEQRYRDVEKLLLAMTDGRTAYCILAIENESKINYAMPVKSGLYDFMQFARQVSEAAKSHKINKAKASSGEYLSGFLKSDCLLPVVTLVVYFGADEWDGPLSLRQMYADCDEAVLKFALGEETVDMCLAIKQMKEESELIGVIRTCKSFGLSKEKTVEHIVNEFGKEYAETEKIVSLYWDKKTN